MLISNASYCQKRVRIEGSFMIVAIGSDGIMVASDSRANFADSNDPAHTPLGYFDFVQKTFILKNRMTISSTGMGIIGQYFEYYLVKDFEKYTLLDQKVYDLLKTYDAYLKSVCDEKTYAALENSRIACGYENGKPYLCYYEPKEPYRFINETYIESGGSIFPKLYDKKLTCDSLGKLAKKAIYQFAADNKKKSLIGGLINIAKVTSENVIWLENEPKPKWKTVTDFLEAYINKKATITFTSEANKKKLLEILAIDYPQIFNKK